jgi:hypothetical protein
MYVIRRRPRDGARVYTAEYLHRDDSGLYWVPNSTARARRYSYLAEANAALEVLIDYLPDNYLLDCTSLEKETST